MCANEHCGSQGARAKRVCRQSSAKNNLASHFLAEVFAPGKNLVEKLHTSCRGAAPVGAMTPMSLPGLPNAVVNQPTL